MHATDCLSCDLFHCELAQRIEVWFYVDYGSELFEVNVIDFLIKCFNSCWHFFVLM